MNKAKKPSELICSHVQRISWLEYTGQKNFWHAEFERRSREAIAHFIQDEKVSTEPHENDGYVERRIELYVASPAEFWACVNAKAEEIALRYSRSLSPQ